MINNRSELATTPRRETVLDLVEAGIRAVLPSTVMPSALSYDPEERLLTVCGERFRVRDGRIFVVGGGKAAARMAEALEKIIPSDHVAGGIVNCRHGSTHTRAIEVREAGSPLPDERGVEGVRDMLSLKERYGITEDDLVLCLISGGGSALLPCPAGDITVEELVNVTDDLLACGAEIHRINAVRKHLSEVKGGRLGQFYAPARVVSVIISDVLGNDLDVIASGPTVPDRSSFRDALDVLEEYGLHGGLPESVRRRLERCAEGDIEENPRRLPNCHNYIIADNRVALEAMEEEARARGLSSRVLTCRQTGRPEEVARGRASQAISGEFDDTEVVLLGGETTPVLPDDAGKGGRNQHYAAASVLAMEDYPGPWTLASVGTDGSDYVADVAGAIVDDQTAQKARGQGLDIRKHVEGFDSYTLFEKLGGSLIRTGDTGTNVCDVVVYLLGGDVSSGGG
ncbi:MAG: DUF4147 domain-containing protein [Planctomycetota bacterium]